MPSIFCPTPAARAVVRDLPPLVVLRAPRGFGKTSTVAYWLRSGELDDRAAVWLTISGPTDADALWDAVRGSLAETLGIGDEVPIEHMLARLRRRVVVVLDGLDRVTASAVDSALALLAQTYELLHLVVITRTERPIESIGPATVDTSVLLAGHLQLQAAEVALLAERLGLPVQEAEAERLAHEFSGWPAMLRSVLLETRRGSDGALVTDPGAALRYASLLQSDPSTGDWWQVVLAVAVPDRLLAGDLTAMLGGSGGAAAAETLNAQWGIVRRDAEGRAPLTGLRKLILDLHRAENPDRYRELNERLSRRRREQGEAAEALTYAVRAEAWRLVLDLLEESWAQVLQGDTDPIAAAVHEIPDELVAQSPRLVVARDYLLHQDVPGAAETALRSGTLVPGRAPTVRALTTTQRLALRFDGSLSPDAAKVLLLGDTDHVAAMSRYSLEVRRAVPDVLTEWALAMLYGNDGVRSAYGFGLACRAATLLGDDAAARQAASGTALAAALIGHVALADTWLAHAREIPAPPSALERIAAPIAEASVAGFRLVPVVPAAEPVRDVEPALTPLLDFGRLSTAYVDILHGRLERARVELQRHATRHEGDQEDMVRLSVLALKVDLALAEGRFDRAGALLAGIDRGGAWTLATRARHAFYVGAYAETMRLTGNAAAFAGSRPRVGLELLLLHACAAWRSGDRDTAGDYLATAVGIADDTGVLLPFLTVPRGDLLEIAPAGSWTRQFLDQPLLAARDTPFPEPLRAGELSSAELRVLRELADGIPMAQIGRRLFIAESTVKTHLRRIYRKLGVASRAAALERARELSLLD